MKAKRLFYLVNASAVRRPRQQKTCTNRSNYRSFVHKVTLFLFLLFRLCHHAGGLYRLQSSDVLLLGPVKSKKVVKQMLSGNGVRQLSAQTFIKLF